MTDEFDKDKDQQQKQQDIEDFFAQFDKISDNLSKSGSVSNPTSRSERKLKSGSASYGGFKTDADETQKKKEFIESVTGRELPSEHSPKDKSAELTPLEQRRQTRMERLSKNKTGKQSFFKALADKISAIPSAINRLFKDKFMIKEEDALDEAFEVALEGADSTGMVTAMEKKGKRRKRKKYRLNIKKLCIFILCIILILAVVCGIFTVSVIASAPEIDPDNIYSLLSESSVLYDDQGTPIDSVFAGDGNRTNVSYDDLPPALINAFIAIEDKTFKEHHGFNVWRMFGAIKESVFSGNKISGTSTITQQLARNLYLTESKSKYSFKRKIAEAYYTVLLERALSKEQIIEAYLNTIYLGYESYGVQSAAQSYFSKDVGELTTLECAALAALPKAPDSYALIKRYNPEEVEPEDPNIIYLGNDFTYVYNDKSTDRRNLAIKNMCDQGYISSEERDALLAEDFKTHMNPSMDSLTSISSYFADYVLETLMNDLMEEFEYSYEDARQKVYSGGLRIYTTMNSNAQKIVEAEFSNNSNFPNVVNLSKDSSGNILNQNGNIMLLSYNNFFDSEGVFTLFPEEYSWQNDGSLLLKKGHRLNFYKTEVQGNTDYSVEFKNMYLVEDGTFYSIAGGVISIPQQYKNRDDDGNLIIAPGFFAEKPEAFVRNGETITVGSNYYVLKQKVVQPQSAMVITDYKTGGIKAMVGGRNTVGRMLFNRATSTRQPGSSIKPMAVYATALQSGYDAVQNGNIQTFVTNDNSGNQIPNMYGDYWTAASVIDDAPMVVNGKQWPKNWYPGFRGLYTMRTSIEQSVNVNAVKIFQQNGVEKTVDMLKKFGITSLVESGETNDMNAAALALGGMSKGISPLEMAGGYGTFGNRGTYIEPIPYTQITNKRGEVILEKVPRSDEVIDPGVAFIMTDMLRSTVTSGIAGAASISSQPVAGKTGTTTDNYDAWFVGMTPQYAASVWIGNDVNIELSQGSTSAARLWSRIMGQICASIPAGSFPSAPDNVISVAVDTKSGKLPTAISSYDDRGTVRSEYFIKGTEPVSSDDIHTYVDVCPESGYLTTPACPFSTSKFGVKRPYMVDSSVGDIAYEVPHYYCPIHNPDPTKYAVNLEGLTVNPNYTPSEGSEINDNGGIDNSDESNAGDQGLGDSVPDETVDEQDIYDSMPAWLRN